MPEPTPVSSVRGLLSTKTAGFTLPPEAGNLFTVSCDGGAKAVGAGFDNPTTAVVVIGGLKLAPDGTAWTFELLNLSDSATGNGTLIITCLT